MVNQRKLLSETLKEIRRAERRAVRLKTDEIKRFYKERREGAKEEIEGYKPFDPKRMEKLKKNCLFRFHWVWRNKMKKQWLNKHMFLMNAKKEDGSPNYVAMMAWIFVFMEIKKNGVMPEKLPEKVIEEARVQYEKTS